MKKNITNWVEDSKVHTNRKPITDQERTASTIRRIIRDVNRLDMMQVLSYYGVQMVRTAGSRALALCPFHADSKLGSFSVNIRKNLCWCFSCSQGGTNVKSYQTMFDVDEKTAALQIACDFALITKTEFKALSDAEYVKTEPKYVSALKDIRPKPVYSDETLRLRTDVYEFMRDYFGLTEEHREYLSSARNLESDRIAADYFSIDTKSKPEKGKAFCKAFIKQFPEYASEMMSIPGFFEHKKRGANIWIPGLMMFDGIGILMRDSNGNIPGVQVRMTSPDMNGIRYKFMSCDFGDGTKGFNRGGATCGVPIDVMFPENVTKETMVCLTEGRFKTEILRQQNCIGVSIQGVNNYYGIELTLNAIEKKTGYPIKTLYTFYDADLIENPQVFKALVSLYEYLKEEMPSLKMYQMVWKEEAGKGIDDCILAGNRSTVKPVPMSKMKKIYEQSLEEATLISGLKDVKPIKMTRDDRENLTRVFKTLVSDALFANIGNKQE